MSPELASRVAELVELGWEPVTTTETTASLTTREPFRWWLFLFVVVFFPVLGGLLYLVFWLVTSRATVFLAAEGGAAEAGVRLSGDAWLVDLQMARRAAIIQEQRELKERGFWPVMWPKLVAFLGLLLLWVLFVRCAF